MEATARSEVGASRRGPGAGLVAWLGAVATLVAAPHVAVADWEMPSGFLPCLGGVLHATPDGGTLVWVGLDGASRTVHTLDRGDVWALDGLDAGACSPDGRWAVLLAGLYRGRPLRLFQVTAAGAVELTAPAGYGFDTGPFVLHDTELVLSGRTDKGDRAILWGDVGAAGGAAPPRVARAAGSAASPLAGRPFVALSYFAALALARTPAGTVRFVYVPLGETVALCELGPGGEFLADRYYWSRGVDAAELSPDGATVAVIERHDGAIVALPVIDPPPGLPGSAPARVDTGAVPLFPRGRWSGLRFSADGRRVAAFEERPGAKPVTRLHVAEDLRALPGPVSFAGSADNVAVDPALRVLATAATGAPGSRGWVDILAVPGGKRLRRLTGLPPTVPARDAMAFSPDGATLFFTRTIVARAPSGAAGAHHVTQDLWAVPVKGGAPRRLARILDRDEPPVPGDK
ncbi:MAG TPA: hypothetical protein VG389_11865 [Myxococcota bacterium]|jgi:hypothetical protein|nr:hypothetical protein [Myxococcota bacterium]